MGMHDQDTDEALFYAIDNLGDISRSGLRSAHVHEITDYLRFLSFAANKAIVDILKFKEPGKKLSHWPGYVEPEQKLIIELACLYHHQKGDVEKYPWETADAGCRNTGSETKEFSGPFFDMILDCFDVLDIKKASGTKKTTTNRLLGEYIKRALKKWKELRDIDVNSLT